MGAVGIGNKPYLGVDTGGIEGAGGDFATLVKQQVDMSSKKRRWFCFWLMVAMELSNMNRNCHAVAVEWQKDYLLVNKTEGIAPDLATAEFQELALGNPMAISAKRGDGIARLISEVMGGYPEIADEDETDTPKIAVVGRPNVGKSTLTNKLVGAHRVIVSAIPGTTRDSVRIPITVGEHKYILIDTAGVRKKSQVDEVIEKFSVIKHYKRLRLVMWYY